jgi:hypothetical protein
LEFYYGVHGILLDCEKKPQGKHKKCGKPVVSIGK